MIFSKNYPVNDTCTVVANRDRTGDLKIFSLTLSQLSYSNKIHTSRHYTTHMQRQLQDSNLRAYEAMP